MQYKLIIRIKTLLIIVTKSYVNKIAYEIVSGAIEVHKELGPGLLESIYEECLEIELMERGFDVKRQVPIKIHYKGKKVQKTFYLDLLIINIVIVELKSKESFHPIDSTQILSQMKLSKRPKGLLINFNVTNITREGLKPYVHEYFSNLPD